MSLKRKVKEMLTGEQPEATPAPVPDVEIADLSVYCITRDKDMHYLRGMIDSLPRGIELVIVNTVHGKAEGLTFDREEMVDGRWVRMGTWTYTSWKFDRARNAALELCTKGWCFWMDSDDRLMAQHHAALLEIPKLPAGVGGVMCGCFGYQPPYEDGKRGSFYAVVHCRAHRRHPDIRWRGFVHEQIDPQINDLGYKVVEANICVYHEGYVTDVATITAKMGRNVRLLCQQLSEDPTYLPDYYADALARNSSTYLEMKRAQQDGR